MFGAMKVPKSLARRTPPASAFLSLEPGAAWHDEHPPAWNMRSPFAMSGS